MKSRRHGVLYVVATDVADAALKTVAEVGADSIVNVATHGSAVGEWARDKGQFDVVIEDSGNSTALIADVAT